MTRFVVSGFGPWRRALGGLVALVALVALALVGGGCGGDGSLDAGSATAEPTETAEATELTVTVQVATVVAAATEESNTVQWTNTGLGVRFEYEVGADPFLLSGNRNPEPGLAMAWSLVRESELAATSDDALGPRGLVIEVFEFAPGGEPESAEAWVRGNARSNFGMGSGELKSTTVGGIEGVRYTWSGLYEGMSVVVEQEGRIWVFTVLFRSDLGELGSEFGALLDSVVFLE
jgi:hypothetical protein